MAKKPNKSEDGKVFGVRIPSDTMDALRILAERDDMTIAQIIRKLIRKHLERNPKSNGA